MSESNKKNELWFAILLTIFTALLTHAVLIPKLGFYRDDWYMLLIGQNGGGGAIIPLFQSDRPFIGYLYAIDFRLLGTTPIYWHLVVLLVKIIGDLAFLWLVRLLWPNHKTETLFLTMLYVVYPGFFEQPIAATYINLIMAVTASLLSFALTAQVIRSENRRMSIILSVIAAALALFYLAIFESMIGLEAARLVLIVCLLMQTRSLDLKSAIKKTVVWGLPYILVAGGFLFWRVFLFQSTRNATDLDSLVAGYAASPVRAALTILIETAKDFFESVFQAWAAPLYLFTVNGNYVDLAVSLILAALAIGALILYLRRYPQEENFSPQFYSVGIWLGVLITILTLLPINLAGRNVSFTNEWDRYTLHAAVGCVLLIGCIVLSIPHRDIRLSFILGLIGIGIITQYHSAAYYRDFWKYEKELWWQLSWRAPNLETNTLLYVRLPSNFGFFEDYEIFSAANLVYTPDASVRIEADLITPQAAPLLQRGEVKGRKTRGIYVHRNYKNALMMVFPSADSCLHVLDGTKLELPGYENMDLLYIAPYSKIDQIDITAPETIPPAAIFGRSPEKNWCYYFQKISLARQKNDWTEAAHLTDEATQMGLQPRDRSEWFPVFEAYANTDQLNKAEAIAQKMRKMDDMLQLYCSQLGSLQEIPASYNYEYIVTALCQPNP